MFFIIVLLLLLIIFDIVAVRWGFDSRDGLESEEWQRKLRRAQIRGRY